MDISKMNVIRIAPYASSKVIYDHFPDIEEEQMFKDADADSKELNISAGALCLYAATLLTKIHENEPENIKCDYKEREQSLKEAIKSKPKFSSLTEEELTSMAHNLILKDIRNSFAHGNFDL